MFYSSLFSLPSALVTGFRLTSLSDRGFLKRTIVKENEEREGGKINGRSGIATSSSPLPPLITLFLPSNAICTANGGHFARARRRTKTLPDPRSMGALRGAILGDVAATPKMAGAGILRWAASWFSVGYQWWWWWWAGGGGSVCDCKMGGWGGGAGGRTRERRRVSHFLPSHTWPLPFLFYLLLLLISS